MIDELEAWLITHGRTIELTAVWSLAVGFAVYAVVKAISWHALRGQRDLTPVGQALKPQKASEGVMAICMSLLYSLTLYAYYSGHRYGVWEQNAVRALVMLGIIGAAVWGLRFAFALRAQGRKDGRQ